MVSWYCGRPFFQIGVRIRSIVRLYAQCVHIVYPRSISNTLYGGITRLQFTFERIISTVSGFPFKNPIHEKAPLHKGLFRVVLRFVPENHGVSTCLAERFLLSAIAVDTVAEDVHSLDELFGVGGEADADVVRGDVSEGFARRNRHLCVVEELDGEIHRVHTRT